MTTKNDITGDNISTKYNNKKFRDNWESIFGQKEKLCKCKESNKVYCSCNK